MQAATGVIDVNVNKNALPNLDKFSSTQSSSSLSSTHEGSSLNNRVSGAFSRTIRSPLFWTLIALGVAITFSANLLSEKTTIPPTISKSLALFSAFFAAVLLYKKPRKIWYEATLAGVVVTSGLGMQTWHNHVDENIILGAIPLHNKEHHKTLVNNHKVGAVLSLVHEFEARDSSLFSEPVLEEEWKKIGVSYLRLGVTDFQPPSIEQTHQAVNFIHQEAMNHKITYVHCKAGMGRSAFMVICYLLKHQFRKVHLFANEKNMVEKAIAYVKNNRPQLYLTSSQKEALNTYYEKECSQKI